MVRRDLKTKEGLKKYYEKVHDYVCVERLKFAVEKGMRILQNSSKLLFQ